MEGGFRQRAEDVIELLRSDVTRYVIVASPHRDTVTEAVWFAGQIAEHGVDPRRRRGQPRPPDVRRRARRPRRWRTPAATDGDLAALWRNVAELRALAEAAHDELAPLAALLGDASAGDGAAARRRRPRPRRARRDPPSPVRRTVTPARRVRYRPGPCTCCWRRTPTGSSTTSSPRSVDRTRRSRCAGGPRRRRRRRGQDRRRRAVRHRPSSTCRSARWAGWRSRCRCASTPPSGACPHVPVADAPRPRRRRPPGPRCGADGWLVKPLDPLRLRRAVRAVLARRQLPRGPRRPRAFVHGRPSAS